MIVADREIARDTATRAEENAYCRAMQKRDWEDEQAAHEFIPDKRPGSGNAPNILRNTRFIEQFFLCTSCGRHYSYSVWAERHIQGHINGAEIWMTRWWKY